ncbi:MAG: endonuclease/exonuclease/phosphatase family protein [Planctomycetaceae bacterium]|nr:endonuclease/exonuclease/phosphatase family protein [Planctomycetaceae bacterium]
MTRSFFVQIIVTVFVAVVVSFAYANDDANTVLRVVAYNVHHCEGTDGKLDVERTASVMKRLNPDLIAVQEIDVNTRRTDKQNQAELLAKSLGMKFAFGKAIDYQGGEYGILILSKFPIVEQKMVLLPPKAQQEQRGVLVANIKLSDSKTIRFACTHLSVASAEERQVQVEKINELLLDEKIPTIIAGDFNARPRSDAMKTILKSWTDSDDPTFKKHTMPAHPNKIDYILFNPKSAFEVRESQTIDDPITSDHDPILSVLIML